MFENTTFRRGLRGSRAGACVGLCVAIYGFAVVYFQKGTNPFLSERLPYALLWAAGMIFISGYVCAVGRAIADSVVGALVATFVVVNTTVIAMVSLADLGTGPSPEIWLAGVAIGLALGPVIGAKLQCTLCKRKLLRSAESEADA